MIIGKAREHFRVGSCAKSDELIDDPKTFEPSTHRSCRYFSSRIAQAVVPCAYSLPAASVILASAVARVLPRWRTAASQRKAPVATVIGRTKRTCRSVVVQLFPAGKSEVTAQPSAESSMVHAYPPCATPPRL